MRSRVAVVGAGSWGTALANLLSTNGHKTTLWSRGDEVAALINRRHENSVYLTGIRLSPDLVATTDLGKAVSGADLVVLVGSNAAWCHPVLFQRMVRNKAGRGAKIVVVGMGLELLQEQLPDGRVRVGWRQKVVVAAPGGMIQVPPGGGRR